MTLTAPPLWQGRLEIRSVPLRGYGFEIMESYWCVPLVESVSVPLRGSPILASPVATGEVARNASRWGALVPCVHFCRYGWFTACVHGAPSTAYAVPLPRSGRGGWRYAPSPYGDMVLKLKRVRCCKPQRIVSVPLRGYGFEMFPFRTVRSQSWRFRPLTGIWF